MFLHKSRGFWHSGTLCVRIRVCVYCMCVRLRGPTLLCVFLLASSNSSSTKRRFCSKMWRNAKAVISNENYKTPKRCLYILAVERLSKHVWKMKCTLISNELIREPVVAMSGALQSKLMRPHRPPDSCALTVLQSPVRCWPLLRRGVRVAGSTEVT